MSDQSEKMYGTVFENAPVGLVLVNNDTTLRDVNKYMLSTFKLKPQEIKGERFGNFFNCTAIFGSGAECGQTEQCESCSLRNAMTAVLNEGITIPDTVMDHSFCIDGTEQKKWFKISASRVCTDNDSYAVISFSDITTLKEYEALLNYQLTLDLATGTINKYALLEALKHLTLSTKYLSIALIDFDDFKTINDTYGHITGDRVLSIFCAVASANTRRHDILGRFGGEEFILIFPDTSAGLLIKALQRISAALQQECGREIGIRPTFSVGVAEYASDPANVPDIYAILTDIDSNLYQAKKRGKNMIFAGGLEIAFT